MNNLVAYFSATGTTKEKNDDAIRPAIAKRIDNIDKYNNILLFFPVW